MHSPLASEYLAFPFAHSKFLNRIGLQNLRRLNEMVKSIAIDYSVVQRKHNTKYSTVKQAMMVLDPVWSLHYKPYKPVHATRQFQTLSRRSSYCLQEFRMDSLNTSLPLIPYSLGEPQFDREQLFKNYIRRHRHRANPASDGVINLTFKETSPHQIDVAQFYIIRLETCMRTNANYAVAPDSVTAAFILKGS
ncbi:hypothetical protein GYMLUDRAFT_261054 [Collybiopsis luxurians FD-317 M1]|uniref:Uncharacterized protein n=1 Tax=Collybiopsis luxurians FD-317 M1 TaxID=944289 RepID=A0A0D0CEW1_9AGAR|nr:hypothetical protein GYMLUDRAFT_261054 [Collybiopsis luxurians FD-317 M1]